MKSGLKAQPKADQAQIATVAVNAAMKSGLKVAIPAKDAHVSGDVAVNAAMKSGLKEMARVFG